MSEPSPSIVRLTRATGPLTRLRGQLTLAAAILVAVLLLGEDSDTSSATGPEDGDGVECTRLKARHPFLAETVGVLPSEGVPDEVVEEAIDLWRGCANYGKGFPELVAHEAGTRSVEVVYRPATSGQGHCGRFVGSRIELYDFMDDGRGGRVPCGHRVLNLAHELGHVLGLRDAPPGARCRGHVMSLIQRRLADRREVRPEECQAVGQQWLTPWEQRLRRRMLNEGTP